jgi:hypothetical protein
MTYAFASQKSGAAIRLPAATLVRDAITAMNARFVESAMLVSASGEVQGLLTAQELSSALADDADVVLRSSCESFLARHRQAA